MAYQVLADGLLVFDDKSTPIDVNKEDPLNPCLLSVSYVIRSAYHQSHGHSPAKLISGQDMFLSVLTEIDWNAIKLRIVNNSV